MANYTIKDLPEDERPRERLEKHGPASLNNAELLAIILRTGTSKASAIELAAILTARFGTIGRLSTASVSEIATIPGIGPAKGCQIAAAFELGRRAAGSIAMKKTAIQSPSDLAEIVMPEMSALPVEHFRAALLDAKNQIIKIAHITQGTLTASLIHPRETFKAAIAENCHAIILIHNHPSGDPAPSREDIEVTKNLAAAGKLLGIKVLDHIVVAHDSFSSMKDLGVIS